jgi:hypothetical protein
MLEKKVILIAGARTRAFPSTRWDPEIVRM